MDRERERTVVVVDAKEMELLIKLFLLLTRFFFFL